MSSSTVLKSLYLASLILIARTKDPPAIMIPGQGSISGKELLVTRQKSTAYYGIPFAAPPLGLLRFSPPHTDPLPSWSGVRSGALPPPACLQSAERMQKQDRLFSTLMPEQTLEYSEDCLYLNIYVPDGSGPPEGWPVMVWFHSGDFNSGATTMWDGSVLAIKQKVIVITVAYRLNVFGFFTLTDGHAPGNYGLLDQIAALEWVNAKISAFGGSPADICIFGHGSGGSSVGLHIVSPLSAGKFSRAIAMSGSAIGALKNAADLEGYVKELGERFICDPASSQMLECLRRIDSISLANEANELGSWGPVVDRYLNTSQPFLPDEPLTLLEKGTFNHVAFMTGFTDMEDALISGANLEKGVQSNEFEDLVMEVIKAEHPENSPNDTCQLDHEHVLDSVLFYYRPQPPSSDPTLLRNRFMALSTDKKYASGAFFQATHTSKFMPTFVYRFDYKAKSLEAPEWVKVPHQYDLPFVWGMPYWTSLPAITWNSADRKMADNIMSLWANFAKTGNTASQTGLSMKWDTFTEEIPVIMIIDRSFHMTDPATFDYKAFSFWNSYYPKVVEVSSHCCNTTNTGYNLKSNVFTHVVAVFALHYFRS